MTPPNQYVLVTPAKDEENTIGSTIESVLCQTIRPAEWAIVSDGSTDRTEEIVRNAAVAHPWIRLVPLLPRAKRSFAAVVHAVEAGVRSLKVAGYEYIGLLDSDLRFGPDYFEAVIGQFQSSPRLGLAGGVVIDVGRRRDRLPGNRQDVPGATQFFRRACFEALGGLFAIPEGGWDALTCARARMLGFETRLLSDLVVDHLKPRNIAEGGVFRRHRQFGIRDYALGYHPVFEACKCLSRLLVPPLLIGGFIWWLGYCGAAARRRPRLVPPELLAFVRGEQKRRLQEALRILVRSRNSPAS